MCQCNKPVVLIVEDRPEVADLWTRHLEPLQMEIRHALTLADAKILSKRVPPADLILLDLRLTDSRDENTLCAIKELTELNPNCAVLVLSGYVTPEMTKLAIEQGAHQVIEKQNIQRASDLWGFIKSYLGKAPQSVQKRMACTSDLIEKLSQLPIL
jgi:DNA-binding NtrC family response regulator